MGGWIRKDWNGRVGGDGREGGRQVGRVIERRTEVKGRVHV